MATHPTRRFAFMTMTATLVLVAVGGYTRGSASGYGCSDRWPLCDRGILGGVLPRWERHMVIEWTHRWVAATVGILAVITAVSAWRHFRRRRDVLWPASGAVVMIGVQAWVGRMVVTRDLDADLVSLHLAISMIVVALVTVTAVCAIPLPTNHPTPPGIGSRRWAWLVGVGAASSLAVLLLGSYVHNVYVGGWPLVDNTLLPELTNRYLTVHFAHRVGAGLSMFLLLYLAAAAVRRQRPRSERLLLVGAATGFVLNVGLGAAHVVTKVDSSVLVAAHLVLAALVWAQMVASLTPLLVAGSARHEPRRRGVDLSTRPTRHDMAHLVTAMANNRSESESNFVIESKQPTMSAELLARYDRPGPRYTSYPTAVEFEETFGASDHAASLADAASRANDPLSLYVHLPFCEHRCSFCACHVVVTQTQSVAEAYLDRLVVETHSTAELLGDRRTLQQYHWGGGTPTFYSPDALAGLHKQLMSHFDLAPGAEVALEVDPRTTTEEHLATLRELGFNRVSMGVQDADDHVQNLIGRNQTWDQTADLHEAARRLGYSSINVDLIYGLPGQSEESFASSLELVIGLRPDRLAVYSFALVPWMRPHQKRIDVSSLPDRDLKFELLSLAIRELTGAGYEQIGMDHFALPGDELVTAQTDGTLSRNFMGYTTKRGTEIVGLGTSAISDIADTYAQNHRRLASYYESVEAGEFPVERGIALTREDRIRRFVITELMCNGRIRASEVAERFGIDLLGHFAPEFTELHQPGGLVESGLVRTDDDEIQATDFGRPFIRNVAMVFDARLRQPTRGEPVFSRTV